MNVLSKILIPRIIASIRYILTELEESEREETFRLKRVKQNKIRDLEKVAEVGAGEMTELTDRRSEMKLIESIGKTIEGPPVIVLPDTESGDPLVVIKPPESGETGDTSKSTQQFQTTKHEDELEDVDKKQDLQEVLEESVQLAKELNSPKTNGKKISLETYISQLKISKSSVGKDLTIISPKDTEEFQETAKSLSFGEIKMKVKIKPHTSDENIQDSKERIAEYTLEIIKSSTEIDRKLPSENPSTISQPESTKAFDGVISLAIISDSDLNQEKLSLKAVEISALSEDKAKDITIKSPQDVSKNEIIKSKSSVRIKLPEDDNIKESPSRSDQKSTSLPSDRNMGSNTIKELVETREKMTEGSVEKLGEGDSQMYTGQGQNIPDRTRIERSGSVEGIVDVDPYFETASISKPSISGVEGSTAKTSITQSDRRKDDYYEADIELDETDVDISTSREAQSSRAETREVGEADQEANTNEPGHDSDVDGRDKRSKSPEDKKRQS